MSSNYSNKIFSNYFLVIISISIVLFLISSFTLIALNSEKIINDFKENIPVVVFIKDQSNVNSFVLYTGNDYDLSDNGLITNSLHFKIFDSFQRFDWE